MRVLQLAETCVVLMQKLLVAAYGHEVNSRSISKPDRILIAAECACIRLHALAVCDTIFGCSRPTASLPEYLVASCAYIRAYTYLLVVRTTQGSSSEIALSFSQSCSHISYPSQGRARSSPQYLESQISHPPLTHICLALARLLRSWSPIPPRPDSPWMRLAVFRKLSPRATVKCPVKTSRDDAPVFADRVSRF
jgi:hypothetical protein